MSRARTTPSTRYVAGVVLLAGAYVASAVLGIRIAAANQLVTAVWPPTGISVAAIVLFGRRFWPGIALGAFVAEAISGVPPLLSGAIAIGNTLAPVLAATMIERFGVRRHLDRVRDVLAFFAIAALTMTVSATVGTTVLMVDGRPLSAALRLWATWWDGDTMGVILIAPAALTMWRSRWRDVVRTETLLFLAGTVVVTFAVWSDDFSLRHLVVPLAIAAGLRLGPRGAAAVTFVASVVAVGTAAWTGSDRWILLQSLNASLAITSLTIAAVIAERDRATSGFRALAEDLEDRVAERTDALERANAHLRELDATKNAILSAVSHELRTPLTAILGFTELLGTPDIRADEEMSEELIERLGASSKRLSRLLQDLLDLGRIESGVIEPQREPRDVHELVDASLADLGLGDHALEVTVEGSTVRVDPTHFERIVQNLIGNAVKYATPGTPISLDVRADRDGGLFLSVIDAGPGIPTDRREQIFEPFERLGDNASAQGAGVGLALVRRFARMHHGHAWVDDAPTGGSAFLVELPAERSDVRVA